MNPSVGDRPEQGAPHPRSSRRKQISSSETQGLMGRPPRQGRCRRHQVPGDTPAVLPTPGSLKGRDRVTFKPWHYTKPLIWLSGRALGTLPSRKVYSPWYNPFRVVVERMETTIKDSYVYTYIGKRLEGHISMYLERFALANGIKVKITAPANIY